MLFRLCMYAQLPEFLQSLSIHMSSFIELPMFLNCFILVGLVR
uniref:Uncharacterized protein n=1 Tax=Rhizophora mucronata TaxID=61149 RepID=A0A2P2NYI7_RHIMU